MGAETEAALTLAPSPAAQDDKDWVALATTWTEGAVTSLKGAWTEAHASVLTMLQTSGAMGSPSAAPAVEASVETPATY